MNLFENNSPRPIWSAGALTQKIARVSGLLLLWLLIFPLSVRAEEPVVPRSSFFAGLGGSYNTINYEQDLFASGTGSVFEGGTLVAVGEAGGPANPREGSESTFAPAAQLGYFSHFAAHDWLWGVKLLYQFVDSTASTHDIDPQVGALDTVSGPDSFTGNVVVGGYRTELNHQFALMPFIGHSFSRSYVYLGAGPALFETQTKIDKATGFADMNGERVNVTGTPVSFSSSEWVWGGAAQIGLDYYLGHDWFLDFNYTYTRSAKFSSNFAAPYSSSSTGFLITGDLFVSPSQRVTNQSFTISVNWGF